MPATEEDIAWFQSTFRPIPKPALPDDCIEYSVSVISPDTDASNDSELRLRLREIQKYAGELQKQWLKEYIWQRQGFLLELTKEDGVSLLRGRTEYGDSIEDEWVIVWILREVTRKFKDGWVKVTDSDGEFLLIEASGTIPTWLEPEVAENRVWINNGQLKIIKPAGTGRASSKRTSEKLSLKDARSAILTEPKRILYSASIEEEAFYRLRNYPDQIKQNMHHALVRLPRKLVYLVLQKPAFIAPAIEAFYLRDPIALKPLQQKDGSASLLFPPEDLTTISITIPKVGYAQLRSQDFPTPPVWKSQMPSKLEKAEYIRADTGMKITCGFEMLLTDNQHQDRQSVREMKMLLDDLASGDERLPDDEELSRLEAREDDEKWLDINFEDLETELGGKSKSANPGKKREFGDRAAQENLQRIVKQFEEFLNNDREGLDAKGIFDDDSDDDLGTDDDVDLDNDDDDGEDKDASFDEDEFTKMMQEMMGMPPEVMKEVMSGNLDRLSKNESAPVPDDVRSRVMSKVEEVDTSDEEDIMDMKQMEAELRASGALDLKRNGANGESSTRRISKGVTTTDQNESSDDDDNDDNNDFDADFARNILQSFKSGGGMGGPAANLLSMMSEEADEHKGTGKRPSRRL